MTMFFRLLSHSPQQKDCELRKLVHAIFEAAASDSSDSVYDRDPREFVDVPGSAFTYWISARVLRTFRRITPFFSNGRTVKQGLATADDFRFIRTWWEVPEAELNGRWVRFAKGGNRSPFYSDLPLVLEWGSAGAILKAKVVQEYGNSGKRIYNEEFYFRPGITWPARPHKRGAFSVVPAGAIFSHTGTMVFEQNTEFLLSTCGILNSDVFIGLLHILMPRGGVDSGQTLKYELGYVSSVPIPDVSPEVRAEIHDLVLRGWTLRRRLDGMCETSNAFLLPCGIYEKVTGFEPHSIEDEVDRIELKINDRAFELYGIESEDRAVLQSLAREPAADVSSDTADEGRLADLALIPKDSNVPVISWLVGVTFGRFDPRLVTRERSVPHEPDPFGALPRRAPSMWPESEQPTDSPAILIHDAGHPDDLAARVQHIAELVRCSVMESLRDWLARDFFPLHIRMYSKSRRKAPIYWQLATPSASYSVWLYIHAFTRDTLFRVQNDYAGPKLAHEEHRLDQMRRDVGEAPKAAERKAIAAQEVFVEELRTFLDEIKRVAPLWKPDLGDGVIINFAPLWRLVPHHKPWQRELKSNWDALCAGEYDWSHLAMHLWPERVVPRCATDRSLAIAHGLEEVFWTMNDDDRWIPRKTPTRSVDELVQERTSTALKNSLEGLLEAPGASGGTRHPTRRRKTV